MLRWASGVPSSYLVLQLICWTFNSTDWWESAAVSGALLLSSLYTEFSHGSASQDSFHLGSCSNSYPLFLHWFLSIWDSLILHRVPLILPVLQLWLSTMSMIYCLLIFPITLLPQPILPLFFNWNQWWANCAFIFDISLIINYLLQFFFFIPRWLPSPLHFILLVISFHFSRDLSPIGRSSPMLWTSQSMLDELSKLILHRALFMIPQIPTNGFMRRTHSSKPMSIIQTSLPLSSLLLLQSVCFSRKVPILILTFC